MARSSRWSSKTGKHFTVTITDASLVIKRDQARIEAKAALDRFYVLRIPVPAAQLDAPAVVFAYKNPARVERDFWSIKSDDDLDLHPVFYRLEERVRAHMLIYMLACYLTWHLRQAWAPLTFTDEHPPSRDNPAGPTRRSAAAHLDIAGTPPARTGKTPGQSPKPPAQLAKTSASAGGLTTKGT